MKDKVKIYIQFMGLGLALILTLSVLINVNNLITKKADALSIFKPFGGKIGAYIPCTCMVPGTKLIFVGPPKSGAFMYIPKASTKYKVGPIIPNNYALGNAVRGTKISCLVASPTGCVSTGIGSLIRIIGTSSP